MCEDSLLETGSGAVSHVTLLTLKLFSFPIVDKMRFLLLKYALRFDIFISLQAKEARFV